MNLMPEMMAAANFGTGYNQGQEQFKQNQFADKMNSMLLQRTQNHMAMEQKLQDHMMQLFKPTVVNPINGQPIGQEAPPPQPPNPQKQFQDLMGKLTNGAEYALSIGDIAQGNELATNAMNMRSAMFRQEQTQAAVQAAGLKRQAYNHQLVAQTLGAATNPQQWHQAMMQVLSDPTTTPEEAANLAKLQYSPETVAQIRRTGMNSYQQAQQQLAQQKSQQEQEHQQFQDEQTAFRNKVYQAHVAAEEAHWKNMEKGGGKYNIPTREEIGQAARILYPHMYPNKPYNPDAAPPQELSVAASDVAGRALQLIRKNKALTFPQALQMAADQSIRSGQINVTPANPGHLFGIGSTSASAQFHSGDTQSDPIPLEGLTRAQLEPGKWYKAKDGRVEQYNP